MAEENWDELRQRLIGFGEQSSRKSYYPELQKKLGELDESEQRFRAIFNSVNDAIFIHDVADGRIVDVNQRMCEMYGFSHEEGVTLSVDQLSSNVHPYTLETALTWLGKAAAGVPQLFEWHARRKDGTLFWVEISMRRAAIGAVDRILVSVRDITERKNAELELSRSERKFRMLFDTSIDPCLIISNNTFIDCNQATVAILGATSKSEVCNTPPWQISPPLQPDEQPSQEKAIQLIASTLANGYARFEWLHCRKDGTEFPVEVSLTRLEEEGHIYVVWRDISERKESEAAIVKSEQRYRSLVNNVPLGISLIDLDYRIVMTNNTQAAMFDYPAEWFTGHHCYEVFEKRASVCNHCPGTACMATGHISECFTSGVRKNGEHFDVHLHTVPLLDDHGAPYGFIEVVEDISERLLAERELRESEERFKALSEAAFGGIIIHEQGVILECNQGLTDITGFSYEQHLGMNGLTLIAPESLDTVLANIRSGYEQSYEVTGLRQNGSRYPLAIRGKNVSYKGREARVIEFRDITDLKRAEEERLSLEKQLLHAQKLESLGVLAGGIAHDFNNILMAIIGNADLALMRMNPESPAIDNLHRIEKAAARAADLAKQMLAYSGKGKFVIEHLDMNRLLEDMLHMLEVSISKKAVLRFNLYTPLPSVEADATQMQQIVMNLVINASEAIGDKSGIIAITTGCMDCDRNYLKDVWLDENLSDGLYMYLEIADSGCGMDKATMARLFDPFFTTKFTGRGLGMAAVLGIVRGHKGAIKVYSEVGKGTTFKILLPASDRPAELFNGNSRHDEWRGSGTVLLVDDEETVRGIGAEMLKELGLTPLTANDGREALELFKQHPEIFLVILDLTMPHMDGEQCFRELRLLRPDVKVIMSSGYNEQEVTQKFVGKGLAGFMQKPYRLSTLREVIQSIAD